MFYRPNIDRLPHSAGEFLARLCGWSPLRKAVTVVIDASDHEHLIGRRLAGRVSAHDPDRGLLLVCLSERVAYADGTHAIVRHGLRLIDPLEASTRAPLRDIDMLVVAPALQWHNPPRLLLTWSAVRLIDVPSFAFGAQGFRRTIATGRLSLTRRT